MKITSCIPLAGQGVIARSGALVAVTDGRGPGPDPLLSALAEVAAAAGDGSELVRRAARAALACHGQPAWACAGITADDGVAVLVHGRAVASVRVAGGQDVTLTASDSVIPVSRTFAGANVTISLAIGDPAAPDPRFWLGGGVVQGGGLAVTATADAAETAVLMREPVSPAVGPDVSPTLRELNAIGVAGGGETWFTPQPRADPAGWHPPTVGLPSAGAPVTSTPATSKPASGVSAGGWGTGEAADGAGEDAPRAVLVEGVPCPRDHFNDPGARSCRQCGIGLDQVRRNVQRRPRPPLGVLVLDDGTRFTLDTDYVLGREPVLDGEVMAGRARPVRISDPDGTVSRLHLRVALVGWRVEISDLGSANGSVLQSPVGERTLSPFEPVVIEPGALVSIGHRSMQYLAYQGVLP